MGTGGMEGCVVLFTPRIHLFVCTHPSVSNTFDCNDLFLYKHQSTALCSNTFGWWFFVCVQASASSPVLQTRLDCGSLFVYKHQSPTLCFKHVWMMVPCLCTRIRQQPFVSNTFDYGYLFWSEHREGLCAVGPVSHEYLGATASDLGV